MFPNVDGFMKEQNKLQCNKGKNTFPLTVHELMILLNFDQNEKASVRQKNIHVNTETYKNNTNRLVLQ